MERTKLGLTIPAASALIFLIFLFGGYVAGLLVIGYVLLMEENAQLKHHALLALFATIAISLVNALIFFLPEVLDVFESFLSLLSLDVHITFVDAFASFLYNILTVVKTVLFVGLALLAWINKPIKVSFLDKLIG